MRSWRVFFFASTLLLTGCDRNASNVVKDNTGKVLGSGEFAEISASESLVSFDETASPITRYLGLNTPQAILQAYQFREGYGRLSKTLVENSHYLQTTDTSIKMIDLILDSAGKSAGIEADRSEIVRGAVRSGRYAYVRGKSGTTQCAVYQLPFSQSVSGLWSGYTAYMSGIWCGQPGQTRAEVDAGTVAFLNSIYYDGGTLNRARAASAPSPIPTPKPAAPLPTVAVSPPAVVASGPIAPIAAGDFLRTSNGGFRVTDAMSGLVTLSNSNGQTSRWIAGFFYPPRGNGAGYASRIEGMRPLRVGQEIQIIESGANDDRWFHTINVLREEPAVLADRTYPCFVLEMREKATGRAQGNYEFLRTVWYSPDLGVVLRFRSRNVVDGRTTAWDIAEIVRK
ncbi:MAG: hypothetical protein HY059_10940 [Proteobacteria bacterium]|nr:hypothetical protein [Pseudomonadota bacterium]